MDPPSLPAQPEVTGMFCHVSFVQCVEIRSSCATPPPLPRSLLIFIFEAVLLKHQVQGLCGLQSGFEASLDD